MPGQSRIPYFEYYLLEMLEGQRNLNPLQAVVLGGSSGEGGGTGTPPGGFIGQLAQRHVTYDTTETQSLLSSGSLSLVDNLNRLRARSTATWQFWNRSGGSCPAGTVAVWHASQLESLDLTNELNDVNFAGIMRHDVSSGSPVFTTLAGYVDKVLVDGPVNYLDYLYTSDIRGRARARSSGSQAGCFGRALASSGGSTISVSAVIFANNPIGGSGGGGGVGGEGVANRLAYWASALVLSSDESAKFDPAMNHFAFGPGGALSQSFVVHARETATASSGSLAGVYSEVIIDPTADSSLVPWGVVGIARSQSGNPFRVSGQMVGVLGEAQHLGSGWQTFATGVGANVRALSGGSIALARGLFAQVFPATNGFIDTADLIRTNLSLTSGSILSIQNLYLSATLSAGGVIASSYYGLRHEFSRLSGGGLTGTLYGIYNQIANSSGSITTLHGMQIGVSSSAGSAIGSMSGLTIALTENANKYAYLLMGQTTIPEGKWSIYSVLAKPSYLSGSLGVGTTTVDYKLDVLGDARLGAASGAAGSRIIGRGEHTSAPAGTLATGEWEIALYDNGATPVVRFRYNDAGTTRTFDVGPLV